MILPQRWRSCWPAVLFALLSLALTLTRLWGGDWVFGHQGADISLEFLSWREFGFTELRHGNLALWNPYIFGGVPYFAGFQSALLYPPNWVHLVFSPATAINWTVAIHLFLAGIFMQRWCRSSGTSQIAATLAGVCWMFSGPFYLRVYAGHLSILCVIPWTPLLWEAIDRIFSKPSLRPVLVGAITLAMMILAGHPQYVYFAGLVTAIYVLLKLCNAGHAAPRMHAVALCACIVVGGAMLSAVQWITALDANKEFVRSVGLDYTTAASFSLPPENLLTFFAPGIFGSLPLGGPESVPPGYFGRCYLWEVSLFMSVAGVILALIGLACATIEKRQWKWIVLVMITLGLSLGAHTPLHRLLYDHLPGFGSFRGVSKFSFLLVMILCKLAADGWDSLQSQRAPRIHIAIPASVAVISAVLLLIVYSGIGAGKSSMWARAIRNHLEAAADVQEQYSDPTLLAKPEFFNSAARTSSVALLVAAMLAIGVLACIATSQWKQSALYGILLIALIELLTFAFQNRALSTASREIPQPWRDAISSLPPDARILTPQSGLEDWSMSWRVPNAWGYDPNVQLRYAQLIAASQGISPDQAKNYVNFRGMKQPLQRLLRIGAVLLQDNNPAVIKTSNPLPVASLVSVPFVIPRRDELLRTVLSDEFNPQISVALESKPAIELTSSFDPGTVKLLASSTDWIEVQANVKAPSILLITNSYSHNWKVRPISSTQTDFEVMPANWAFIGIPLKPGAHHLLIEYAPSAFVLGAWISVLSIGAVLALSGWQFFSTFRKPSSDN